MKTKLGVALLVTVILGVHWNSPRCWSADIGTAMTYQGWVTDGGEAAAGPHDFRFQLFDGAAGGSQVGSTVYQADLLVSNGVFTTTLDFGQGAFAGQARWLQIAVRPGASSGSYTLLSPRQELTPTAYAIYAASGPEETGDIEEVVAGTGLIGGGASGVVTLGIDLPADLSASTSGDTAVLRGMNTGDGYGLYGWSGYNHGVYGHSHAVAGIQGYSGSGAGVAGINGNWGNSGQLGDNSHGVYGKGSILNSYGVYGEHQINSNYGYLGGRLDGAHGYSAVAGGSGVAGIHESSGNGLYGRSTSGWAALLDGRARITGRLQVDGNAGIGTGDPEEKLHVSGRYLLVQGAGGERAYLGGDGVGNDVQLGSLNTNITSVSLYNAASSSRMHLNVKSLTIFGGADLAEPFPMTGEDIPQGAVVVIDESNPGHLRLSDHAYDRCVAGIVSGAKGVRPGIAMHQDGVLEGSQQVALSGRVYALVDADVGTIKPGDLLTTSDTPGHAMKVTDHARAQGAILGKAMTGLSQGRGLVLVLVSLQ